MSMYRSGNWVISSSPMYVKRAAPITGPTRLPMPPNMAMSTGQNECLQVERDVRVDIGAARGNDRSGHTHEDRAHREHQHLGADHVYAAVRGRFLILADALQSKSIAGAPYERGYNQHPNGYDEHGVVGGRGAHRFHKAAPRSGHEPLDLQNHCLDQQNQGEGEDGEIGSLQPKGQGPYK